MIDRRTFLAGTGAVLPRRAARRRRVLMLPTLPESGALCHGNAAKDGATVAGGC